MSRPGGWGRSGSPLSPRERQVLRLVVAGLTNPEIAEVLYLSKRTVESHRTNLLRKLGARRAVDLARLLHASEIVL